MGTPYYDMIWNYIYLIWRKMRLQTYQPTPQRKTIIVKNNKGRMRRAPYQRNIQKPLKTTNNTPILIVNGGTTSVK